MPTRHTITHADEIYAGNAFQDAYSPDGRRGVQLSHLHHHEFLSTADVPAIVEDPNGILAAYATPSLFGPTVHAGGTGANVIALCTGALATGLGATVISLDVARNITFVASGQDATVAHLYVGGRDIHGNNMVEKIEGATQAVTVQGKKAFKEIDSIGFVGATIAYATVILTNGTVLTIGSGSKLGLPFHLPDKGKMITCSFDGHPAGPSSTPVTAVYTVVPGSTSSNVQDSAPSTVDAYGTIEPLLQTLDGTATFSALMKVDASTNLKAFGAANVSSVTDHY